MFLDSEGGVLSCLIVSLPLHVICLNSCTADCGKCVKPSDAGGSCLVVLLDLLVK